VTHRLSLGVPFRRIRLPSAQPLRSLSTRHAEDLTLAQAVEIRRNAGRTLPPQHRQKAHGALRWKLCWLFCARCRVAKSTNRAACANEDRSKRSRPVFVGGSRRTSSSEAISVMARDLAKYRGLIAERVSAHQITHNPSISSITSDNICHMKSPGVGSDSF